MQHDHVQKKLNVNLLTPPPGSGEGRGVGVCGQTVCYHIAAFNDHIPKKLDFDLLIPPRGSEDRWGSAGSREYVRREYVLTWCSKLHFLLFDMQHDQVL